MKDNRGKHGITKERVNKYLAFLNELHSKCQKGDFSFGELQVEHHVASEVYMLLYKMGVLKDRKWVDKVPTKSLAITLLKKIIRLKRKNYQSLKRAENKTIALLEQKKNKPANKNRKDYQNRTDRYTTFLNDAYNESKKEKVSIEKFQKNYNVNSITPTILREMNLLKKGVWIGEAPSAELVIRVMNNVSDKQREYDNKVVGKKINYYKARKELRKVSKLPNNPAVKTMSEIQIPIAPAIPEPTILDIKSEIVSEQPTPVETISEQPTLTETNPEQESHNEEMPVITAELVRIPSPDENNDTTQKVKINELSILWEHSNTNGLQISKKTRTNR